MKKKSNPIFMLIGNTLMLGSIASMLYLFYPIIKDQLSFRFGYPVPAIQATGNFVLHLPTLGVNSRVIENVDPWNEAIYQQALHQGVAHAEGSALPGQSGSVYMFSHASDMPWRITRYNTAFYRLNFIDIGDEITVDYQGRSYTYKVRETKVVWPHDVQFLTNQERDQLILQTCTPIVTDWKRFLVFADPV